MKIIVMSDTHGNYNALFNVINENKNADLFLHLGDGASEFFKIKNENKSLPLVMVKGNCDFHELPNHKIFNFDGVLMYACHGDFFNVKIGLKEYVEFAKKNKFKIIAYGHTHKRFIQNDENLCIINPGSLTLPRSFGPSYGVLEISGGEISAKIIEYS